MTTSTSALDALESLQTTLEPLAELHGQHNQLESWVNDSCQALEKLHGELAEWQNELARKQTELDLREDALEKCQIQEEELGGQVEQWKADLEAAQLEAQQLGEENADQIEQLVQLERRCIELEAELKVAQQRSEEMTATLEAERARAVEEQTQWKEEFKGMRDLLDKQCSLLATQLKPGEKPASVASSAAGSATSSAASSTASSTEKSAGLTARRLELRQRAQTRLAAKRREQEELDSEGPAES
ncbi:MAG: hypothetical protein GXP24_10595 [Planctomycetes bacterium]|nr:hypothetical protein [Planctomycetota bacterium]